MVTFLEYRYALT